MKSALFTVRSALSILLCHAGTRQYLHDPRAHPTDRITRANYQLGVLREMLSGIALLGLGLASLGIYGVIARTMAQRSGEFAIRLALGAQLGRVDSFCTVNAVMARSRGVTRPSFSFS